MIDADKALEIAYAEAERLEWGGVPIDRYQATYAVVDGKSVWRIAKRQIVIGKQVWFVLDAATGDVLEKRWQGPR